jgi:lipopolysaccharide transport system permease protein
MAELTAPAPPHEIEIIIEPTRGGVRLSHLRELWEYRDLLALLVRRDFLSRYQQTLLGPLWHFLQPVLTALLFTLIFSRVAGVPTDGIPAPLFYFCGLLGWNYFAQNLSASSGTFVLNQGLFTKVWFPRLVVPLSAIVSNLVALALQMVPFAAFYAYYALTGGELRPGWQALLLPVPILHLALLSLGVGLWMAASTAKYRDLVHLHQYIVQLWMFATPVIYPLSKVPASLAWLVWLNPASVPVEMLRWCLLGRGTLSPVAVGASVALTLALLLTGIVLFQNAARSAADTV